MYLINQEEFKKIHVNQFLKIFKVLETFFYRKKVSNFQKYSLSINKTKLWDSVPHPASL